MAYIFQVDEQELRELWGNQHKDEVTEQETERYKEIWTHIEECDGNFYGVDKYMVSECIRILWKVKDKTFHIAFLDYIRNKLLTKDQTWPHFMKYFGWIFLLLWSSGCALLAIVYGISFDIKYDTAQSSNFDAMGYNEECWDMNPQLIINEELTEVFIDESINNLNNNYGTHIGDSSAWLLSLLESTLISIFFWQPLTIYFITWLMIWLFSWNLPVLLKPKILLQLIKKIFGVVAKNSEKKVENEIELAAVVAKSNKTDKKYDSVLSLSEGISTPTSPISPTSQLSIISDSNKDTNSSATLNKKTKKKNKNKNLKKRSKTISDSKKLTKKEKQNIDISKKKSNSKDASKKEKQIQNIDINKKKTNPKRERSKTISDSKKLTKSKSPTGIVTRNSRKISIKIVNKHGEEKSLGGSTPTNENSPHTPNTPNTPKNPKKKRAMTLNDLPKNLDLSMASNIVNKEMDTPTKEVVQFKKGGTRVIEKVHKDIDDSVVEMDKRGFLVTVHHKAEQEEKNEYEKYNAFGVAYGTDKYTKIVTKEQRPFDVFSFFGAEIFFLDVVKSDDGKNLDVKGYCIDEWKGEGEIIIEEHKKKRNAWDRVVSFR